MVPTLSVHWFKNGDHLDIADMRLCSDCCRPVVGVGRGEGGRLVATCDQITFPFYQHSINCYVRAVPG